MQPNPPGFDPAAVVEGLHTAMTFGMANSPDDQATFCWSTIGNVGTADSDGVPFNPAARPNKQAFRVTKPCAIEYVDAVDKGTRFAEVQSSKIQVTLLQPDYDDVAAFEFVVWCGDKYLRRSGQVYALGALDVHVIQCVSEDES